MAYHLSIFMENKPGKLERITKILAEMKINVRAVSVADGGDFGVVKILANETEKAYQALKNENVTVSKRRILIVPVPDEPGGLYNLLSILSANQINIKDCYGFVLERRKEAVVVIEAEKYPPAEEVLLANGYQILSDEELSTI